MGNIAAIFWKEMRSYFGSPIAYVVATGFLVMMGYLFQNEVVEFRAKCLNYTFQHQEHGVDPPNVNEDVVFHFFLSQCLVWLVVTPMLTMRLFAEEKGSGDDRTSDDVSSDHVADHTRQIRCLSRPVCHYRTVASLIDRCRVVLR